MKPIIDLNECLRDSPNFRNALERNEKDIELLETKLEKIIKQCSQMVQAGRTFNTDQEQLVRSMWELSSYFAEDVSVQSSLNYLLDTLKEAVNYHRILVDQAARAVYQNFTSFIKEEIKKLKDKKHWFEKSSTDYDSLLNRSMSSAKFTESEDLSNLVVVARKGFRHKAIDYVHGISVTQGKKRYETVDALLSYTKAYNTFYHQGTDHFNDIKPNLDKISEKVKTMRDEVSEFEKDIKNSHFEITGNDLTASMCEVSRDSSLPVNMDGYLFKRTNNAFKTWNRRYFTLTNNQLVYRKRSGDEVTVMEEDMRLCNVRPTIDVERKNCFEIISVNKSHVLQAECEESATAWVNALHFAISSALQSNDFHTYSSPLSTQISNSSFYDQSPQNSPVVDNSNKKRMVSNFVSLSGNSLCCDCGSPDPKWASINLGITLCIECCGIHRALGVHYSKVRSLGLDKWDDEVIKVMEHLGNETINHIYLANFDKSVEKNNGNISEATPSCSRSQREEWIQAKYVERRFAMSIKDEEAMSNLLKHSSVCRLRRKKLKTRRTSLVLSPLDTSAGGERDSVFGVGNISLSSSSASLKAGSSSSVSTIASGDYVEDLNLSLSNNNQALDAGLSLLLPSLPANELLLYGAQHARLDLMVLALAQKADKNCRDDEGRTPLHLAVLSGTSVAVEFLLINSVQVNLQDNQLKTPLHLASQESNIVQVYELIKFRADQKIADIEGRTAIDHAVLSSEPELVTLLRVATLYDELDKEEVEEEMYSIMQELRKKKSKLLLSESGDGEDGG